MSFKTYKFDESATMRSLERLAINRGMIKPDEMKKVANVEFDLSPSDNLTSNVLKLVAGLRREGLEAYADDIENHFVQYKQAQTLYETSKEKGEDLIDAAHPKGSHKLEGVQGDAVVETILDNHLKMIQMVNKKPTGKLSNAKDIIKAVKISLAEEVSDDEVEVQKSKLGLIELRKMLPNIYKIKDNLKFKSPGAIMKKDYNAGKIIEVLTKATGSSTEMCNEIEESLNGIQDAFRILQEGDIAMLASVIPISAIPYAYGLYENIKKNDLTTLRGISAVTPIGALYNIYESNTSVKKDISNGIVKQLTSLINSSKLNLTNALSLLNGTKDDQIKEDLEEVKNKKEINNKVQKANQRAMESYDEPSSPNKLPLKERINAAVSKLYNIINHIKAQTKISDSIKNEHLSWANAEFSEGKKLLSNNEVSEQDVSAYENEVKEFATTWGL